MRGEVYELKPPRDAQGHEQQGRRFCVVVQSDDLPLSTCVVVPTSTSARPSGFRPTIELDGKTTHLLPEQTLTVDPQRRLGRRVGHLGNADQRALNEALRFVLGLDDL